MIIKVLVYVNTALMVALLGGGFFGYRYVTSPQFEKQIKNVIMGDLKKAMPNQIQKQLPKTTGLGLPM
mgnify:CR=1 FL=1